nr:PREDICTED: uncharacterized protein LOC107785362 [Nicotiana tabacum]
MSNINRTIWIFIETGVEWELIMDTEQQVTIKVFHQEISRHIIMTFVNAKCSSLERLELWDYLYYLASDMDMPWLVGSDFNVILYEHEKIGRLPVHPPEYEDSAFCINSCGLFDLDYKANPFTWWNGSPNEQCIFKRLDRIFVNLPFQNIFPNVEVEHLIQTGSDHAPLLMSCGQESMQFVKPFKFLNLWTKHDTFKQVDKQNWLADFIGDPFLMFKQKLKRVKIALSHWSKVTFGDIFKKVDIREDIVRKQKAGINWFAEGDRNTRFFHNYANGKRRKLNLKRIQGTDGYWLERQELMANAALEFFSNQFTQTWNTTNDEMLNNVPTMVTLEYNLELCKYPTIDEVKDAIFALSRDSASRPDGFTGLFY